ncbi:hypothetical protein JCM33774_34210 [Actinophytocola sp. KF-1]
MTWDRRDPAQCDAEGWREDTTTRVWNITDIARPRLSATLPNSSSREAAIGDIDLPSERQPAGATWRPSTPWGS